MKLEIRDKDHAAILEKAFNDQTVVEFHGVSLAINERGYSFDGRSSWTFGFHEVSKLKWNGEGNPPAGTICELKTESADSWGRAEIMYSSPYAVVWRWEGLKDEFGSEWEVTRTRPLKTPEQIAAEEREKAVREMGVIALSTDPFTVLEGVTALYDAGYRKV